LTLLSPCRIKITKRLGVSGWYTSDTCSVAEWKCPCSERLITRGWWKTLRP